MLLPALLYIVWDIYFTSIGIWKFNESYITGIKLFNLPLEEIIFFFVVPYCCVFIYACVRSYFPGMANKKGGDLILKLLGTALFAGGIILWEKQYTGWTFSFAGLVILLLFLFKNYFRKFDAASFLVSYLICLIPFLIVNGFLTALPVVEYNDLQNLGIRIYSIPVEDTIYGMLLILMNVVLYEKLKNRE